MQLLSYSSQIKCTWVFINGINFWALPPLNFSQSRLKHDFLGARIPPKISKFPRSETHSGRFRKIEWSNGPEIWTIDREHHQLGSIWVWTRSYHQIFPQNGPNTRKTRLLIKTAKNGHFEGHSRADCENISDSTALRFKPFTKDNLPISDFGDNRDPVTGHFGRRPKAPVMIDCKPLRRKLDEWLTILYSRRGGTPWPLRPPPDTRHMAQNDL